MSRITRTRALAALAAAGAGLALAGTAAAHPGEADVFSQTNSPAGNRVQTFDDRGGDLVPGPSFPTGGAGTGAGLGSQGSLALEGRWLLAVNAGSDELSLFRVRHRSLVLTDVVPSGGDGPVSVTTDGRRAYVVNGGGPGNVAGFTISDDGRLDPIPGSVQPLSQAGAMPAQVQLTPDGGTLVVTEKATNRIDTFPVAADGSVGPAAVSPAAGQTPFGFAVDRRGRLFVSEAFGGAPGASTVSSYAVLAGGGVSAISAAVATTQTAACWVVLSGDQRFAYATNTGSGTITGFRIARDGSITRLDPDGVTAVTGGAPSDAAVDGDGRTLYALTSPQGAISSFRVRFDGRLTPSGGVQGLPAGLNGLVAR